MRAYMRLWMTVLFSGFRRRRDLMLENAALRQQLVMYERRRHTSIGNLSPVDYGRRPVAAANAA